MATITTKAGPWNMTVFSFDEGDADNPLGRINPDEVQRLPFGAIELDRDGRVVAYNDTEPDGAGPSAATIVGRPFFDDVARWASNSVMATEFRKGVESGDLNVVFDCGVSRLAFKVRIHMKVSPILSTYWVFTKKLRRGAA